MDPRTPPATRLATHASPRSLGAIGCALGCVLFLAPAARADEPPPAPVKPSPAAHPDKLPEPPAAPAALPDHAEGVVFEEGTPRYEDVLKKAVAAKKPIFIDFFTEWCGWCKRLDADTYPKPAVAKAMEAFINVRVDAEKGEGVELAKRFGANGFPTLVIVGTDDQEIDRIVGYLPPEQFTKEIERILSGKDTLPTLRKAVDASPDDLAAAFALVQKLAASNAADALTRLEALGERAKGKDRAVEAGVLVALARHDLSAGDRKGALERADRVSLEFGDTEAAKDATRMSLGLRAGRDADPEDALAFAAKMRAAAKDGKLDAATEQTVANLHLRAAERAMARAAEAAGDDAQKLNAVAWTCFERHIATEAATGWARKAVEKSERDPQILDTLANLLASSKKYDEALSIELEALGALKKDDALVKEFQRRIAEWVMARDAMKADKVVPATKTAPVQPKPKPAPAAK